MAKTIMEILGDAEKAQTIATGPNGEEYVSMEDYVNLTTADTINGKDALRVPEMNPDGTPAGSIYHYLAVDVRQLLLNRYAVKDDKLCVVTDWWSINEQDSGRLPRTRIPCFVIGRKDKKLVPFVTLGRSSTHRATQPGYCPAHSTTTSCICRE